MAASSNRVIPFWPAKSVVSDNGSALCNCIPAVHNDHRSMGRDRNSHRHIARSHASCPYKRGCGSEKINAYVFISASRKFSSPLPPPTKQTQRRLFGGEERQCGGKRGSGRFFSDRRRGERELHYHVVVVAVCSPARWHRQRMRKPSVPSDVTEKAMCVGATISPPLLAGTMKLFWS